MDETEYVTITRESYDDLTRAYAELKALHAGGVDSWEWYSESLREAMLFDEEDDLDVPA